jgi:hypothetical protein
VVREVPRYSHATTRIDWFSVALYFVCNVVVFALIDLNVAGPSGVMLHGAGKLRTLQHQEVGLNVALELVSNVALFISQFDPTAWSPDYEDLRSNKWCPRKHCCVTVIDSILPANFPANLYFPDGLYCAEI